MKKLLTLAALLGLASLSYGQGTVLFSNGTTTLVSTNAASGGGTFATAPGASAYVYGLFMAPSTVSSVTGVDDANWAFTGIYAYSTTSTTGGRLNGGTQGITGTSGGQTVNLLVRGWSANIGTTWSAADAWYNQGNPTTVAGSLGTSGIGQFVLGGGAIGTPTVFGLSAGQIGGFNLAYYSVPEPTSLALAGLGAAGLLIFRRRK